jgi:hypothetical protein
MVSAAVLMLTAGALLVFGSAGWRRVCRVADLQRDGSVTLATIRHSVRASAAADLTVSAERLEIARAGRVLAYYRTGRDLFFDPDTSAGGDEQRLVAGAVSVFAPTLFGTRLSLRLDLEQGDQVFAATVAVHCRN